MSSTDFVFVPSDGDGCTCTTRDHMIVVEEWTYINHGVKIPPASIYFNMNQVADNVMFFSFEATDWHGQMTRFVGGVMHVKFNCKGDTNNMHTTRMKKTSSVEWVGEDYKRRPITMVYKCSWCWCPRCEVWTQ